MKFLAIAPSIQANTHVLHNIRYLTILVVIGYITTIATQTLAEIVDHVTCGSVVKLANEAKPKVRLHSHDVKYGSGSGQQSVTAAENQDTNSYWSILGTNSNQCNRGEPIECGSQVRLQHVQTRKFLHSHLFKSPLSSQQEVSAFGGDGESDTGDHWMIYCKTKYWQKGESARLKHVDTDTWLSLSGNTYGRPIYGQMEVICTPSSDAMSHWKTVEGVFVQPTGKTTETPPYPEHNEL
uniref:Stromal cell-derived factor 2-like protein 1 n=1 Tax=Aceria tosichella TaxID=561515 RepID=A0A6G1S400_9ACAR